MEGKVVNLKKGKGIGYELISGGESTKILEKKQQNKFFFFHRVILVEFGAVCILANCPLFWIFFLLLLAIRGKYFAKRT